MDLSRDRVISGIVSRLKSAKEGAVKVEGTWGSFARLLATHISEKLERPILYICPHIDDADKAADDLTTFSNQRIEPFAAWEGEEDLADATDEIRAERLKLVSHISSFEPRFLIPTSIQALCQPIPNPQVLRESCLRITTADKSMNILLRTRIGIGFL